MPRAADVWWDDLRQEAELPPPPPPSRARAPVVVGVLAAAAVAGGLGWWLSTPSRTYFDNPEVRPVSGQAVRTASPTADPEQVRRAYEEFGLVYANGGVDGLARFSESCAQSLQADPRILDFCLAFDMFAATVGGDVEPSGKAEARRVALVQTATPAADPDLRIAEVQRLMRVASGVQTASAGSATGAPAQTAAPMAAGPAQARMAAAPAKAQARPVRVAKAQAPRRAATAAGACRLKSTPADRLLCANPTLRVQERRMKEAYDRALAAGADPLVIDRGQAEWRAVRNAADSRGELADLYARRTRELSEAAETARRTPLS